MIKRLRSGFTLVELLVVIAIIGILIALLLPAVQAAREAARRSQCTNNLKQIGIAFHNYADVHKKFAPSSAGTWTPSRWGWGSLILPFMEQQPIYDDLDVSHGGCRGPHPSPYDNPGIPAGSGSGRAVNDSMQARIEAYLCPSEANSQDDLAITGTFKVARVRGNTRFLALSNYVISESIGPPDNPPDGGGCQLAEITDGTSNTMLVAEKDQTRHVGATWTFMARSTSSLGFRAMYPPNSYFIDANGHPNWDSPQCSRYAVGSMHPGGLNVLFCDGSVHFISETIDAVTSPLCGNETSRIGDPTFVHRYWPRNDATWQKLYCRKDGRPVSIE